MSESEPILEPARQTPMVDPAGVVGATGGARGIAADTRLLTRGPKTLLVERYGFLGGIAFGGLMTCVNGFRNQSPPNALQAVRAVAALVGARSGTSPPSLDVSKVQEELRRQGAELRMMPAARKD